MSPGRIQGDDVTRVTSVDDGFVERNDDQEIPTNALDHFVPNTSSLSAESESESINRRKHDKLEAVIERPTEISSEHVGADAPHPVQSDRSECECE